MKKAKIIMISIGVFVLLLAVILSVAGSVSKRHIGTTASNDSFNTPMGMGLSPSSLLNSSSLERSEKDMAVSKNFQAESPQSQDASTTVDKKIIKNGNLTLKVDKVDDAVKSIGEIAKANGGDIFSSNFYKNSQDQKSGTLTAKVPVANFETAYNEAKKVAAAVLRESTSGQDVTEQYQDLEGRIKNKQVEEEAYKKILTQAQKISDIIEVTQALSRVRGEIERFQGQLKYLASQTDMATITINLSEDANITISDSWRPLQVAKDAIRSLVVGVQNFIDFLIVFMITFIPTIILYLIVLWVVYRIGRKFYLKIFKNKEEENKT